MRAHMNPENLIVFPPDTMNVVLTSFIEGLPGHNWNQKALMVFVLFVLLCL